MNSRTVWAASAAFLLAVALGQPADVQAEEWLIKTYDVQPDTDGRSDPEVPNSPHGGSRTAGTIVEAQLDDQGVAKKTPMTRPQNWLLRAFRFLRAFQIGGLAR